MFSIFKKLKNYISPLDRFLKTFDKTHPEKSEAQQEEIDKHERIFKLRDQKPEEKKTGKIWESF